MHILLLFAGIGFGGLRTVLAAGKKVRLVTYVDKDPVSRRIAGGVLEGLQRQHPELLSLEAIKGFDRRLPQDISQIGSGELTNLIARNGMVDMVVGGWECQPVSKAGRGEGLKDPRFDYFYDMVGITNFLQREQRRQPIHLFENTYPGQVVARTRAVLNAGELVEAFLGAPVVLDAAGLRGAAHRVRLYWTNFMEAGMLQAAILQKLQPEPTLKSILKSYHIPTAPGFDGPTPK